VESPADVDLELRGEAGQVDVHLDPVRRSRLKARSIVSLRRSLEDGDRASTAAAGPRPDEELAAVLAYEFDCGR